jgi:4-amino-4-deoxy-L-arabinose transferase-like glycosyltransferase
LRHASRASASSDATRKLDTELLGEPGRLRGPEIALAFAAAAAVALAYVALAGAHGALGAARNDDFAYYRITFDWVESGDLILNLWPQMSFVGQSIMAWPVVKVFGPSIAALQVSVALLGALGVALCYVVCRRFLPRGWAALCCLTLAVGPVFGTLAVSFMTDVPAFATQMLTLYAGLLAIERRSLPLLAASAAACLVSFSIREFGMVAFLAVLVVALVTAPPERRAPIVGVAVGLFVAAAAVFAWRHTLPGGFPSTLERPFASDAGRTIRTFTTLGLFLAPVTFAISPRRVWSRSWAASRVLTLVACTSALCLPLSTQGTTLGPYVDRFGTWQRLMNGADHPVMGEIPYLAVRCVAVISLAIGLLLGVVAVCEVRNSLRRGSWVQALLRWPRACPALALSIVFTGSTMIGFVVLPLIANAGLYDRYLIVVIPFVAAALVTGARRYDTLYARPARAAALALSAFAVFGFVYVDDTAMIDGAKWQAAERLSDLGVASETIDGGLEWFGFHQRVPMFTVEQWLYISTLGKYGLRPWWTILYGPRPVCATVRLVSDDDDTATPTGKLLFRERRRSVIGSVTLEATVGPDKCGSATGRAPRTR